jgi:hypothetical protein
MKTEIADKQPGQPGEGRPKNSKDTEERKERTFKPQTGATIQLWAIEAQEKISELVNPYMLSFYNKKNMRSLSSLEYSEAENIKTKIFFSLEPQQQITKEVVLSKLNTIDSIENKNICHKFSIINKNIANELDRQLTAEEVKFTKAYFYNAMV